MSRRTIKPVSSFPMSFYAGSEVTEGETGNHTLSSSYYRITSRVYIACPAILRQVLWDIKTTETYNVQFVDGFAASPTVLYTIASGIALTGHATTHTENTITLPQEIYLAPGQYFISIVCSNAVLYREYASGITINTNSIFERRLSYDGTQSTSYVAPVRFVFKPLINLKQASYTTPIYF